MNGITILENGLIDISDIFLGKKCKKKLLAEMQDIDKALTLILSMIFTEKYKWEGLPPELKERSYLIEWVLFWYGAGLFFKNERDDRYYFLPATMNSSLNVYGEPTKYYAYGLNGKPMGQYYIRDEYDDKLRQTHKKNAILVKNNKVAVPQYFFNKVLIKRMCYIWKTLGVEEGLARIKLLIYANEDLAPKIKDVIEGIIESPDVTAVVPNEVGSSLIDDVKETQFGTDYTPETSWYDFDKTFNLLLTLNGIDNNIETNKKERQTRAEVTSGTNLTAYANATREEMRTLAIDEIRELFGLELECYDKVAEDLKQKELEYANAFTGGGGEGSDFQNKKAVAPKKGHPNK